MSGRQVKGRLLLFIDDIEIGLEIGQLFDYVDLIKYFN